MKTLDYDNFNTTLSSVGHTEEEGEAGVIAANKYERPKMFKVLLHNDDYTTMEFVIHILKTVFFKNEIEAENIMLEVHEKGFGVCGVYTFEIAETKQSIVIEQAESEKHPLKCTIEQE